MDPSSALQTSDSVVSLSRYFAAASLGFALWEHAITLDLECQLVWRLSRQSTKWVFLLNRYGLIFGLAYSFCVTLAIPRRHLNDKFCQSNIIANLICIMLSTFCSNIYLVIRLHQLWDRRRSIFYVLISAMAVTHTASFCLSVAAMKRFFGHISYDRHIGACNLAIKESALMAAWALIVAFDVIMVATLTTNALDRPRHRNIELLGYLKSDSAAFFAGLLVLRVIALVFLATLPPSKAFIYSFYLTWPLTSAAMSRFVLGSEAFTYRTAGQADYLTYEMETRKWRPRVIERVPGSAQ